jgi:hypothetical protein
MSDIDHKAADPTERPRKIQKTRDLFVHIGAPKTGTTALQNFLHDNRKLLIGQGVLYPDGGYYPRAHHLLGAAVFPKRASRLGGLTRDEALKTSIEAIRAEIDQFNPRTVILSTEYLWGNLSPANITRLLTPFRDCRIHIVVYIRRQDLLAQSLYVQSVKRGDARSFSQWLTQAREGTKAGFHFDQVLAGWRNCGINTEIIVRVYEKGQLASDIREDFMNTVAAEVEIEFSNDQIANTSPDITTIELLRTINAGVEDKELANVLRRRVIAKSPPRALFEPLSYFGPGEASAFVEEFAEGNAALARQYLGREDGVLFRDPPPVSTGEERTGPTPQAVLDRLLVMLPEFVRPSPGNASGVGANRKIRRQKSKSLDRIPG